MVINNTSFKMVRLSISTAVTMLMMLFWAVLSVFAIIGANYMIMEANLNPPLEYTGAKLVELFFVFVVNFILPVYIVWNWMLSQYITFEEDLPAGINTATIIIRDGIRGYKKKRGIL